MRYFVLILASVFLLSGCSLFRRSPEKSAPGIPSPNGALAVPDSDEEYSADDVSGERVEGEVAKLNTKVEALETKLEVLTMAFEKLQAKKNQPEISAISNDSWDTSTQPSLAAPVNEQPTEMRDLNQPVKQVAASPAPPARGSSAIEAGFRKAMTEFQQGKYREAAQQFSAVAQMDTRHLLAAHALYWSGEANARVQQWSSAIDSWQTIEKSYPTSTYVPEALAGLAKAYEVQGDVSKSNAYRNMLTHAFPNSPVALATATNTQNNNQEPQISEDVEQHEDDAE